MANVERMNIFKSLKDLEYDQLSNIKIEPGLLFKNGANFTRINI